MPTQSGAVTATAFTALVLSSIAVCGVALNTYYAVESNSELEAAQAANSALEASTDDLRLRIAELERENEAQRAGNGEVATAWIESIAAAMDVPCATEDSDDCYWMGGVNGEGQPFVNVRGNLFRVPDAMLPQPAVPSVVTEYVEVPTQVEVPVEVPVDRLVYVPQECPSVEDTSADWFQNGLDQGYENGYADGIEWAKASAEPAEEAAE